MNLLALFVNYNNSNFSIKCADSLLTCKTESINVDIVIIDNNSSEEEKRILQKWDMDKSVRLLMLNENVGYFPALNIGLDKYHNEKVYQYTIIGNNDLTFNHDFLLRLFSQQYNDDVFVIAPNIINADNCHQNPQVLRNYSKLQLIYLDLYYTSYYIACFLLVASKFLNFRSSTRNRKGYEKSQYILKGYGACYILTHKYLEVVGGIPDYLFLMNEESALTDIVLKNGGRTYYDNNLVIHHNEHTSVNQLCGRKLYDIAKKSYKKSKQYFDNNKLCDQHLE